MSVRLLRRLTDTACGRPLGRCLRQKGPQPFRSKARKGVPVVPPQTPPSSPKPAHTIPQVKPSFTKKYGPSAHFGPGSAVPPSHVTFSKVRQLAIHACWLTLVAGEGKHLSREQRPNGGRRPCPLRRRKLRASTAEMRGFPSPQQSTEPDAKSPPQENLRRAFLHQGHGVCATRPQEG